MKTLIKSLLLVLMVLVTLTSCAQTKKSHHKKHSASTEKEVTELSPVDKNGYFNVLNAPQTNSKFKAESEENEDGSYTTKIYKGKKLLQTFNHEATSGEVRFIDMNFDGHVDLFVGPAASRTYNNIYLYNKKKDCFEPAFDAAVLNGYFLLNENKKHFVSLGSGGASSTFYQKFTWNGKKIEVAESMMEFSEPSEYADYGVSTKYTLFKGDDYYGPASVGCVEVRTNNLKDLPKEWQKIIDSFENMEQ
ncbi:MAG: hypothetical protein IK100_00120 [Muribaculaceae bacterium]|nr:hypothetical protein [Muribaculaceae bacterium]